MQKVAIIVAGGSGSRMGTSIPKQFLPLREKPVLWYSLDSFLRAYDDLEIILVVAKEYASTAADIIRDTQRPESISIAFGGQNRFHSVKNGLQHIHHPSIVFVHDAVRCVVSKELIHRCYETALKIGNAIPAIKPVDSMRIKTDHGHETIDRERVRIIQTPQTFASEILQTAFEQEYTDSFTDEATVVERLGIKINLVDGECSNIKITTPFDLFIAEKILTDRNTGTS